MDGFLHRDALELQKSDQSRKREKQKSKGERTFFAEAPAVAGPAAPFDRELTTSFCSSNLFALHSGLSSAENWRLEVDYSKGASVAACEWDPLFCRW